MKLDLGLSEVTLGLNLGFQSQQAGSHLTSVLT